MGKPVAPRQLVLALDHAESFARDDFLAGPPNAAALSLVDRWPDWPAQTMTLVGPEGSGKRLGEADLPAAFATGALVVDDLVPEDIDERALFHLLNLAREEGAYVLFTARTQPAGFPVVIRDLASRLRAIPTVTLAPPDDTLLRALMVKLAADRQIELDEPLVNFLANRIERSFSAVHAAIKQLDLEAMRQHRPVTRALAATLWRDSPI